MRLSTFTPHQNSSRAQIASQACESGRTCLEMLSKGPQPSHQQIKSEEAQNIGDMMVAVA